MQNQSNRGIPSDTQLRIIYPLDTVGDLTRGYHYRLLGGSQ